MQKLKDARGETEGLIRSCLDWRRFSMVPSVGFQHTKAECVSRSRPGYKTCG